MTPWRRTSARSVQRPGTCSIRSRPPVPAAQATHLDTAGGEGIDPPASLAPGPVLGEAVHSLACAMTLVALGTGNPSLLLSICP